MKKVRFNDNLEYVTNKAMICTINGRTYPTFTKNTWIRDSGAMCHFTNNNSSMYDVVHIAETISGVSGEVQATKIGKIQALIKQVDGTSTQVTLYPIKYCPKAVENLFSIIADCLKVAS